jgi:hypothetical protein
LQLEQSSLAVVDEFLSEQLQSETFTEPADCVVMRGGQETQDVLENAWNSEEYLPLGHLTHSKTAWLLGSKRAYWPLTQGVSHRVCEGSSAATLSVQLSAHLQFMEAAGHSKPGFKGKHWESSISKLP